MSEPVSIRICGDAYTNATQSTDSPGAMSWITYQATITSCPTITEARVNVPPMNCTPGPPLPAAWRVPQATSAPIPTAACQNIRSVSTVRVAQELAPTAHNPTAAATAST